MAGSGEERLYELLDSLISLRIDFANGADGERALAAMGRAKVLEVRTILDTAIHSTKRVIDETARPKPQTRSPRTR
jgi:hypothetical protein